MKVQLYTAVVVMGVLAMGAARPPRMPQFLRDYLRNATADLCGDDGCAAARECFKEAKPEPITTQEELDTAKANLATCAETYASDADFSKVTLEDVQPPTRRGPIRKIAGVREFLMTYGVTQEQVMDMMKCMMDMDGTIERLRTCLTNNQ